MDMAGSTPNKARSSQALAERLVGHSPDAMLVSDREGIIVEVNPQAERLFGFSRGELLGTPMETLVPGGYASASASAHPVGLGLQPSGRRKDGTEFPAEIMLRPVPLEGEILTFAVIRDITEHKRIEDALRKSEMRFERLVEGVKDYAIFMLDTEGRASSWNSGAERIHGYRAEEIVGRHFSRFFTQEDLDRGKPADELKTAATEGRAQNEGWRVRKDGSRFWAEVVITATAPSISIV